VSFISKRGISGPEVDHRRVSLQREGIQPIAGFQQELCLHGPAQLGIAWCADGIALVFRSTF
jgi:hypothetical protein